MIQTNPSQERRRFGSGVIVDDLSIGPLHVLQRCGGNRSRFRIDSGQCQRAFLQAEIVEDQEPQQPEATRRTREPQEVAARLQRQQANGARASYSGLACVLDKLTLRHPLPSPEANAFIEEHMKYAARCTAEPVSQTTDTSPRQPLRRLVR